MLRRALVLCALAVAGCNSPYRSDRGALFGGLTGAGVGAIVGNAVGDTAAGAAIGAGVGALSGAAVGASLDDIEAQNRAEIAAHLGRPVPATAVTMDDVIQMTRAGVNEDVIITHVRAHGVVAPLRAGDLIMLQQQGVPPRVVQAMQSPQPIAAPVAYQAAPPMVVQEVVPAPVYWGPPVPYYYRPRPSFGWGVSVVR